MFDEAGYRSNQIEPPGRKDHIGDRATRSPDVRKGDANLGLRRLEGKITLLGHTKLDEAANSRVLVLV